MGFKDVSNSMGRQGQPRMKAICDTCGRDEVFACRRGDEGQARKKITNKGWAVVQGKLLCPACEARRKAMVKTAAIKPGLVHGAADEPPREPTRGQVREILTALADFYDIDAQQYQGGTTDNTLAEMLDVMPGWVARERERAFGPAGGNQDMERLLKDVDYFIAAGEEAAKDAERVRDLNKSLAEEGRAVRAKLDRVCAAVGAHVMKGAK